MLSDDEVEDEERLVRNSLFIYSDLEYIQIMLIGKHARSNIILTHTYEPMTEPSGNVANVWSLKSSRSTSASLGSSLKGR